MNKLIFFLLFFTYTYKFKTWRQFTLKFDFPSGKFHFPTQIINKLENVGIMRLQHVERMCVGGKTPFSLHRIQIWNIWNDETKSSTSDSSQITWHNPNSRHNTMWQDVTYYSQIFLFLINFLLRWAWVGSWDVVRKGKFVKCDMSNFSKFS